MHVLCGCTSRYPPPCKPCTGDRECCSGCTVQKRCLYFYAGGARSRASPNTHPTSISGHDSQGAARLDDATLGTTVQRLLQAGLAPATQRSCLAGKRKYLNFCQQTSTPPLPVTERKLVTLEPLRLTKD